MEKPKKREKGWTTVSVSNAEAEPRG